MCSETSEAVGTTWEHAQLEFQKYLKIRITLIDILKHFQNQEILKSTQEKIGILAKAAASGA